ncbi:MAG: zf-HC2 domain-containing protein [Phycisphaerales bacterium]|nr:zf-HC2 domain-containing protein [Phycisphaerales bacterium]
MFNPSTFNSGPDGITCRDVIETLMAYIDGELSPHDRAEIEKHLSICRSCVNYLESYRASIRAAAEAMRSHSPPTPMPDDLVRAILEARNTFDRPASTSSSPPRAAADESPGQSTPHPP